MFIGEYEYKIDKKNRLAIPVKFRDKLKKGMVATRGIDTCLSIYTKESWEKLVKKLRDLPISKSKNRAFNRLMLAGAMDKELDSQGRITLPDFLMKYANLSKKAIIAGLYDRLEIWDKQIWEEYKKRSEASSSDIAEALDEIGI
ncbi:MAG TPA: division/cell wall cluster transcriptional repressor MraZ [Patescibacteria group bacterium]|nr:division/cell wall cluster transcriptional repressor MraZ [Patescibacteria group bacterium]